MKKDESLEDVDTVEAAGEGLRVGVGGTGGVVGAEVAAERWGEKYMRAEFVGEGCMRSGEPGGVKLVC